MYIYIFVYINVHICMYIIHVQLFFRRRKQQLPVQHSRQLLFSPTNQKDGRVLYTGICLYIVHIDAFCNRRNRMNPAGLRCTAQACEPICVL